MQSWEEVKVDMGRLREINRRLKNDENTMYAHMKFLKLIKNIFKLIFKFNFKKLRSSNNSK